MGYIVVSESTLDRTTVEYNWEHREFDIMINGRRIHSMNSASLPTSDIPSKMRYIMRVASQ